MQATILLALADKVLSSKAMGDAPVGVYTTPTNSTALAMSPTL